MLYVESFAKISFKKIKMILMNNNYLDETKIDGEILLYIKSILIKQKIILKINGMKLLMD